MHILLPGDIGKPIMIEVREEQREDALEVRKVNERAFGQMTEAFIVDALRKNCGDLLSLVAVDSDRLVGHILFSPVVIECEGWTISGMGLAPMAVLPEYQRRGIGTALVHAGVRALNERRCPFVIVLGHAGYYPRFGFERASRYAIRSQWEGVPDEAFMVLMLDKAAMQNVSGIARYRAEFDAAV
jgi:putative acetyltransferase